MLCGGVAKAGDGMCDQMGSYVDDEKLRFDFSWSGALSAEQVQNSILQYSTVLYGVYQSRATIVIGARSTKRTLGTLLYNIHFLYRLHRPQGRGLHNLSTR